MHRVPRLTLALLAMPLAVGTAQVKRWNDRADVPVATADAPTVTLTVDGARVFSYATPVRVRFKVSDNAYVVVARVASDGRLTIIFPQTRNGRTYVRANSEQIVRGRKTGAYASFYTSEPPGTGFVFAIASYAPLDLSAFKNADFERVGLASPFQLASRNLAWRPESMIERFASWVLFDEKVPFDYDVDFYSVDAPQYASQAGLCMGATDLFLGESLTGTLGYMGGGGYNPESLYCRSYYNAYMWCLPFSVYSYSALCSSSFAPYIVRRNPETTPGQLPTGTSDSTPAINRGVLGGGLWQPDTVGHVVDRDPRLQDTQTDGRTHTRSAGAANAADWDHVYSIPRHTLDQLKKTSTGPNDAGPERGADRNWRDNQVRAGQPAGSDPAAQRRAEPARRAEGAAYEQPRRAGDANGTSSPRTGNGPTREAPRSYAPPPRETAPPRETPRREGPPRETPRGDAGPAHETPRSEPTRSAPPKSEPTPQPTKGSSTGENPKKPPF